MGVGQEPERHAWLVITTAEADGETNTLPYRQCKRTVKQEIKGESMDGQEEESLRKVQAARSELLGIAVQGGCSVERWPCNKPKSSLPTGDRCGGRPTGMQCCGWASGRAAMARRASVAVAVAVALPLFCVVGADGGPHHDVLAAATHQQAVVLALQALLTQGLQKS